MDKVYWNRNIIVLLQKKKVIFAFSFLFLPFFHLTIKNLYFSSRVEHLFRHWHDLTASWSFLRLLRRLETGSVEQSLSLIACRSLGALNGRFGLLRNKLNSVQTFDMLSIFVLFSKTTFDFSGVLFRPPCKSAVNCITAAADLPHITLA